MPTFDTINTPDTVIHLRGGRALGYAEYGDPAGKPVFFFHGWPGSRLQRHPDDAIAASLGARLITIDRPGFGLSDFKPGRTLLDWPDDVAELADILQIEQFAAVGISGGGPYLLACAFKIPHRLTRAAVISGLAPLDWPGATGGMPWSTRVGLSVMKRTPWWLPNLLLGPVARRTRQDPEWVSKRIPGSFPTIDRDMYARPDIKAMMQKDLTEAYRNGTDALAWELAMLVQPWGFRLENFRSKFSLWHGEADRTTPFTMGTYMARMLPECEARFYPGEGHTLIFNHWQEILAVLVS